MGMAWGWEGVGWRMVNLTMLPSLEQCAESAGMFELAVFPFTSFPLFNILFFISIPLALACTGFLCYFLLIALPHIHIVFFRRNFALLI